MAKGDKPDSAPDVVPDEPSDEGIIHDEYTDPDFVDTEPDALDMPLALRREGLLDGVADDADGIEAIDTQPSGAVMDTVDTGARHRTEDNDGEMGIAAEPHSVDELEDAAIGHELRGARAHTRDDEVHGERMFDSPDAPDDDSDDSDDKDEDADEADERADGTR